ncbi:RDD family protein [Mycobacterium sp. SMC-18]|uniref:RDD family protein n=1 Tax=Mycobacteriaceae TaxID=1762 RepID=UPI001BB3DCC2|nr:MULTISPECIES: RDD family protein [unclassified Mycolicibacterium]BCI78620.1 RDD family protein [Mycolicibacterium sp. TY66]BCJ83719.1 RDD family protein [Mycolicibacterium sp. TY81]
MTVGEETTSAEAVSTGSESEAAPVLASWPARAGAFALDVLLGLAIITVMALLGYAARADWTLWVYAALATLAAAAILVNRWLLPSITGWSVGRSLFAIRVERVPAGVPAGMGRLVLRDLAHLLDTVAVLLGWLWPLWDPRHRTFADLLLHTEVRVVPAPERDPSRRAGQVLVAGALVCLAAVGLSYGVQFRHDRAVDEARHQISEQGPKIVEHVLSYGIDTYQNDFKTAQALVTDGYRDQLIKQQQAVSKKPTTNQYYAVSSAILSAGTDQATMLLALQGQRGVDANTLRFITATVRVDFVKSHDGKWQLSNLTVLKSPRGGR